MYKKIGFIVCLVFTVALAMSAAVQYKAKPETLASPKLSVSASFYPLAYLAKEVGGDKVTVTSVIPNGIEPHDFEPTPQNVIALRSAKIFIYNGNGLDAWAERLRSELEEAGVTVIPASQAVTALPVVQDSIAIGSATSTEPETSVSPFDPHIWLDPIRARQISELIRDAYINRDPANAEYYRQQAMALANKLNSIHNDYEKTLANCASRTIVVSHDAFHYPAVRYNLNLYAIAGLSPDAEPSIKHLSDLTKVINEQKISTVFFETLANANLANTLAKETGVTTAVLNPIEGLTADDLAANRDYESIMRDNLQALSTALICK